MKGRITKRHNSTRTLHREIEDFPFRVEKILGTLARYQRLAVTRLHIGIRAKLIMEEVRTRVLWKIVFYLVRTWPLSV